MTIPLLASSLMTGFPLKAIGHRTTNTEIDAMMHLWRYIATSWAYSRATSP